MKINYTCYSIRKFFLIFLAITCQVGIINATTKKEKFIQEYTKIMNDWSDRSWKLYSLLKKENEKKLTDRVINYNTDTFINTIKTNDDKTALQVCFSSFYSNDNWSKRLIKELLNFKKLDVNQIINPKELELKKQQTGLAYCMSTKEYEYALIMLNHPNIDVNVKFSSNHSYQGETTVLMEALYFEEKKIIKKLLTGTYKTPLKVNEKNKQGKTALIYAMEAGEIDIVKWLLEERHKLNTNQLYVTYDDDNDETSMTPLIYAINFLHKEMNYDSDLDKNIDLTKKDSLRNQIIPLLITHDDTNPNLTDKQGLTALIHAIYFGEVGIVKSLLGKKKNNKIVVDVNQKFDISLGEFKELNDETALMYAIYLLCDIEEEQHKDMQSKVNFKKIIDLLIGYSDLKVVNKNNCTALTIALEKLGFCLDHSSHYLADDVNKFVLKSLTEIIPNLLNAENVNIKASDNERTALMVAIMTKQKDLVNSLLNTNGINVDLGDINHQTAFFYAIANYDKDIFELILNATKKLNHQNKSGQTPLLFLINQKFKDQEAQQEAIQKLAEKLKEKGQIDYRPDNNGPTALHSLVLFYIDQFQNIKKTVADRKNDLKKQLKNNSGITQTKYDSEITQLEKAVKECKKELNTACITNMNSLVDAGADPTITFKDPDDGQEKTAISLITDELVKEHEELGTLKSYLEEPKKNNKKVKDKNKDPQTKDQDTPTQDQDEGNGMNIGTVVIIIAAVGSLVVGAIVAVPLLFKKQKATKGDSAQSKDNTAKPKPIST